MQPLRSLHHYLIRRLFGSSRPPAKESASPMPIGSEGHQRVSAAGSIARPARTPGESDGAPPDGPLGGGAASATMATAAPLSLMKRELEKKMCSEPLNWILRCKYFDILENISLSHLGTFYAILPEIATPLIVRASTSDIWNLRQIFLEGDRGEDIYI
jgi:hypothetical protein